MRKIWDRAFKRDRIARRLMMTLAGVGIVGVTVGVTMSARLGMDPFGALTMGLGLLTGIPYGAMLMIAMLVMAAVVLLLDGHYLNVSTVLGILLVGPVAQAVRDSIDANLPLAGFWLRLAVLLVNLAVLCLGASLNMTADMGVSSYDALPIIVSNKTGWPFRLVRLGADGLCALFGLLAGAAVGIGTLLTALALGPVIDMFNRKVSLPLLYRPKLPEASPGAG